ncbi:MAG: hypothetical protein U9N40_06155 [Euryarchaeota archaeon]|nr:hypothetical protein [Euryarchaeota archaeon]
MSLWKMFMQRIAAAHLRYYSVVPFLPTGLTGQHIAGCEALPRGLVPRDSSFLEKGDVPVPDCEF